jgi:hypothetical protein
VGVGAAKHNGISARLGRASPRARAAARAVARRGRAGLGPRGGEYAPWPAVLSLEWVPFTDKHYKNFRGQCLAIAYYGFAIFMYP